MTTVDLLLVRHGATAHTAERRFSGCTGDDPVLSPVGERQAASLAARLAGADVAAVVSSPLARAHRTAEVVAAACRVPVRVEADLREIDFGVWEGRTLPEVERDWPDELAAFRADPSVSPPGGESVDAVAARVAAVRCRLTAHGGAVVVVTHLYPVRLSVLDAVAAPYASVHRMSLEPTAVSTVTAAPDGSATLVRYNDVAHLSR